MNNLQHSDDVFIKKAEKYCKHNISNDLEKAANKYADGENPTCSCGDCLIKTFKKGAKWQKKHFWKSAEGSDLPIFDREVIVLYQRYPLENCEYSVSFAHRPKEYWEGKNIETGEITRYYPKRYDKGGWNIPDVKWWLDLDLPNKN